MPEIEFDQDDIPTFETTFGAKSGPDALAVLQAQKAGD